jgi:hypothetical protein
MKKRGLLIFFVLIALTGVSQNKMTISSGESSVHKLSDNAKALNEAIMDAQTNAVIAYGGNINVLSISKKEESMEIHKGTSDKKNKSSGQFSSNDKFFLQNSVSAMVKNIDIKADTVWISNKKYKVRVNGTFEVNLKDVGTYLTDYLNKSEKKIKIEIKENDCFGQIYKPMSEYFNRNNNNFFCSNHPWLISEGDYKIEINADRAVLYDQRFKPNVVIRVYSYKNCQSLINKTNDGNPQLDEMLNEIYSVYLYKSVN